MILDFTNSDIRESNSTVLNGSYYGGLLIDSVEGKSEQNGTPSPNAPVKIKSVVGANLLENTAKSNTVYGITYTVNADGTINANGTATNHVYINIKLNFVLEAGKTYILNGCPTGGSDSTYFIYLNGKSKRDYGSGVSYSETDGSTTDIVIAIRQGTTLNNLVFKPMVRYADNTDDTYVPYGNLSVKTSGKNLLKVDIAHLSNSSITVVEDENKNIIINGTSSSDVWTKLATFNAIAGKQYAISCSDKLKINVWDDKANKSVKIVEVGEGKATFTATNTGLYIIVLCNAKSTVFSNVKADLMVNEGATVLPYEPYKCSTVNFTANLHGIGDVKDRIIKKDGLWQIERRFKEAILNGSETWSKHNTYNLYFSESKNIAKTYIVGGNGRTYGLCKEYPYETNNNLLTSKSGVFTMYSPDTTMSMRFCFVPFTNENITTLDGWKARLSANPVTVVYELATPEYIILPPVDQAALNSLLTFNNTTYISTDSAVESVINTKYGATRLGGYALLGATSGEAAKLSALQVVSFDSETGVLITKSEVQL